MKNRQWNQQTGASLMEVLVAMSISLVVTASMVALMANSLGNTSRIIKMTKLTDDMRIAMQMMSRDVCRSKAILQIDLGEPPFIDPSRCYGCRACIPACPSGAIRLNNHEPSTA